MRRNGSDDDFLETVRVVLREEIADEKIDRICLKISDIAGGGMVYVSKQHSARISVRNTEIVRDHIKGLEVPRLANKYLLSKVHIARILRNHK